MLEALHQLHDQPQGQPTGRPPGSTCGKCSIEVGFRPHGAAFVIPLTLCLTDQAKDHQHLFKADRACSRGIPACVALQDSCSTVGCN